MLSFNRGDLSEAQKRQNKQYHDDQSDQVNQAVHVFLPKGFKTRGTKRLFDGNVPGTFCAPYFRQD